MKLPTIKIVNKKGDGFVLINESDFNPETMGLWDEELKSASIPANDAEPAQCAFIKGDGERCSNKAQEGSEYCHIKSHKGE